jgi:hypothetical protein
MLSLIFSDYSSLKYPPSNFIHVFHHLYAWKHYWIHFLKVFPILLSHSSEFLQVIQNFVNTEIVKWAQIKIQIVLQSHRILTSTCVNKYILV